MSLSISSTTLHSLWCLRSYEYWPLQRSEALVEMAVTNSAKKKRSFAHVTLSGISFLESKHGVKKLNLTDNI